MEEHHENVKLGSQSLKRFSETNQRFMFGSPSIAEGQIYENIMAQSKTKRTKDMVENGQASGKNIFGLEDKYKAKRAKPGVSRKKIPAEKTSAQLGNSKSMPAIGFYGRKVANDLRTHEGDKCFPIGSKSLRRQQHVNKSNKNSTSSNQLKDESGFLFGSPELLDRYRKNGDRNLPDTNNANNGRSNGITGGGLTTPPIGSNVRKQYGLVDLMDGEARLRRKINQKYQDKPFPLEGDSKYFEFAHGSDQIRNIRINHKPENNIGELIHGGDGDISHFAFSSNTFNDRHKKFEEQKRQGSTYDKHNMLFSYEAPKRVKTEKEKRAEIAKIWNPPASMHNKPTNVFANENKQISSSTARSSRGNLYKNDERLYGGGGYKGTEVDTRNFTSGYYEQKEFRESFSKNTSVAAKAPF